MPLITRAAEARMRDELLHAADQELFELLSHETWAVLRRKFVEETLDADDCEWFIFALIAEHNGKDRDASRERAAHRWESFLHDERLLENYRQEIEQAWLEANGGDDE